MSEEVKQETPAQKTASEWVRETYETFIKDAADIEPTNPEKAIAQYFEKNATDELKARVKAEGKTAAGCYKFIFEVARLVSHGGSCHIDPGVVYAMAMHYFEDVPVFSAYEAGAKSEPEPKSEPGETEQKKTEKATKKQKPKSKKPEPKPAKPANKPKPKKADTTQGFFFDLLEEGWTNAHA